MQGFSGQTQRSAEAVSALMVCPDTVPEFLFLRASESYSFIHLQQTGWTQNKTES